MKDAAWITLRLRKNRTFPVTLSGQQDIRGGGCRLPSRRATVLPLVDGTVHPKRPSCRSNSWAEPAYSRRNLNEAGGLFGRTAHELDDFGVCGKFPQVLPRCRTCFGDWCNGSAPGPLKPVILVRVQYRQYKSRRTGNHHYLNGDVLTPR